MDNDFFPLLKKWFDEVSGDFPPRDAIGKFFFDLKRTHSDRVAGEMGHVASAIGLPPPEVTLARAIGLLHDIGRFPQLARFGTLEDAASVDHGDLGADIVRGIPLLESMETGVRSVIETAVRWHNKARLPDVRDDRSRLFARMIRDADKIDIYRVTLGLLKNPAPAGNGSLPGGADLSLPVLSDVAAGRLVRYEHVRNRIDLVVFRLAWIFDLQFPASFARLESHGHWAELRSLLPKTERVEAALKRIDAAASTWRFSVARGPEV